MVQCTAEDLVNREIQQHAMSLPGELS